MKKFIIFVTSIFLLTSNLTGCSQKNVALAEDDSINIVSTIFAPYDFTREIVGDNANVHMLLPPGAESHSFEPTPQDIIKIQNADVFVHVGGDSDEWVASILDSIDTSKMQIVTLMDCVDTLEEEIVEGMEDDHGHSHEHGEDEHHDHDEEDHHHEADEHHDDKNEPHHHEDENHNDEEHHHDGDENHNEAEHHHDEDENHNEAKHHHHHDHMYDEHVWTSPKNAKLIVQKISNVICQADPANADAYQENTKNYISQLEQLDTQFESITSSPARKTIIVGDRFPFRYLVDAYGIDYFAVFPGCSSETEPSAATIAFLISKIQEESIPVVFHAELSNKKMANTISEATGAKVLLLHACHNVTKDEFENGINYIDLMKQNIKNMEEALN